MPPEITHWSVKKKTFGRQVISYACPNCGEGLSSPISDAGQHDGCPDCGTEFVLPKAAIESATIRSTPPPLVESPLRRHRTLLYCALLVGIVGCVVFGVMLIPEHEQDDVAEAEPPGTQPTKESGEDSGTPVPDRLSATDDVVDEPSWVEEQTVNGTGVKKKVLLAIMNTNASPEKQYHHKFKIWARDEKAAVEIYKDSHSSLMLSLLGPPDDLTLITLAMPIGDFIGEKPDGEITGDGAAAFGRCVQRMAIAVDPNWTKELYDWMNKRMPVALITKKGATLRRKRLIVKFNSEKYTEDITLVSLAIGIPEKK